MMPWRRSSKLEVRSLYLRTATVRQDNRGLRLAKPFNYLCMEQPNRRGPVGIGTMSVRSRPAPPEISNRRRCAISNQKVTVLPYVSPRCACGRDLPRGRRVKCYFCLPIRRRKINAAAPDSNLAYTLEDRVAQAYAYGLSYGKFMAILHDGGKLPPQLRPIVWPAGSEHAGK